MEVKVDKEEAKKVLLNAYNSSERLTDGLAKKIETVLRGSHLTYRYILFTGILSKATNANVDPLSIQKGDNSQGAYDARSICHKVVVPFEREFLADSLGGSNEPYLNKPARFVRMSQDNAVRSGNDRNILLLSIEILSSMKTKAIAERYLKHCTYVLKDIYKNLNKKFQVQIQDSTRLSQTIFDYTSELLKKKNEGETAAIVVAAIESIQKPSFKIIAHKVNESGASSNEVGDIDIKDDNGNIVSSIEVKDKDFTKEDLEHAIKKFIQAGLKHTMFVYGLGVDFPKKEVLSLARHYGQCGCLCSVISIMDLLRVRILDFPVDLLFEDYVNKLLGIAKEIKAKEPTIVWIIETAIKMETESQ